MRYGGKKRKKIGIGYVSDLFFINGFLHAENSTPTLSRLRVGTVLLTLKVIVAQIRLLTYQYLGREGKEKRKMNQRGGNGIEWDQRDVQSDIRKFYDASAPCTFPQPEHVELRACYKHL